MCRAIPLVFVKTICESNKTRFIKAYRCHPLTIIRTSHGPLMSSPGEQLPTAYTPLPVSSGLDGGAAYITTSNDTTFVDCSFEGNHAVDDGNTSTIPAFCTTLSGCPTLVLRRLRELRGRPASVAIHSSQRYRPRVFVCRHPRWPLANSPLGAVRGADTAGGGVYITTSAAAVFSSCSWAENSAGDNGDSPMHALALRPALQRPTRRGPPWRLPHKC